MRPAADAVNHRFFLTHFHRSSFPSSQTNAVAEVWQRGNYGGSGVRARGCGCGLSVAVILDVLFRQDSTGGISAILIVMSGWRQSLLWDDYIGLATARVRMQCGDGLTARWPPATWFSSSIHCLERYFLLCPQAPHVTILKSHHDDRQGNREFGEPPLKAEVDEVHIGSPERAA
ncbi:hypothetical protein K469DRAFT_689317 [Zopfia rhizophila CBS 207.26]|uniref:Uncharacterized protein n=1 Tax=Zopfia rhizophila CBS 207.26 TaxID=1314779 RepID=A0A6A6ETH8_9PEZI|nr:hypothetical protein K469DRAFT_689317 [Zopfia rhizophila CBS 207.26]